MHITFIAWKVSKYRVISGSYFPAFGLNTEICEVSLRIQSKCGKKRTRNNSAFEHFSRSFWWMYWQFFFFFDKCNDNKSSKITGRVSTFFRITFGFKNMNQWNCLRYYATFNVRNFEPLFYKINACLQKTTTCIGLRGE